jgi:hypothetical protein
LPEIIEAFARDQGDLMGADPAALAAAALPVCAAAIPDTVKLQPKRHDPSWLEESRIWMAIVGGSSEMKTAILRQAAAPLVRIDVELFRNYLQAKDQYDLLSAEQRRTAPKPKQKRLRIEDTTIEAAQEILRDSPDGVLCLRDELSGWFGSMDKYAGHRGATVDRGFWLQAYNGGTFAYSRISRGSSLIENLSVSILGGIQPEPMRSIVEGTVDDGLLQRVIMIMVRPAEVGKDAPRSQAAKHYGDLIGKLHRIVPPFDNLFFDDRAMAIRHELEKKHIDLMRWSVINKKLAAHIGKYNGIFARLCIIWHCIEHVGAEPPPIVSEQTASRVAKFMHEFLLPHVASFYSNVLGLSDDHDRLTAVAGYILARKLEMITNRDVQRGDRTMRKLDRQDIDSGDG